MSKQKGDMLGDLVRKLVGVPKEYLGTLKSLVEKLAGREGPRLIEKLKKLVRDEMVDIVAFFKTRDGLWVSNEFRKRILVPALEQSEGDTVSLGEPFTLPEKMTDAGILKALGNLNFRDARAFCHLLASIIEAQWGGKSGDLLHENYAATLFYVTGRNEKGEKEVFTVCVRWRADDRRWDVRADRLDDDHWREGNRAFPCN